MSRITTPFNAQSTAAEVIAGVDLKGKRAVVTGGASGIGLETARALAAAGAQVTLAVRNTDAGERAAADGQSKTATILFTVALAKKWAADGITANALHPGGIMTNLQRHLDEAQLRFVGAVDEQGRRMDVPPGWKTPQQGAATSVLLAASPHVQGVTGRYFEDSNEAVATEPGNGMSGVASYALDPNDADRLWDETARLLAR